MAEGDPRDLGLDLKESFLRGSALGSALPACQAPSWDLFQGHRCPQRSDGGVYVGCHPPLALKAEPSHMHPPPF